MNIRENPFLRRRKRMLASKKLEADVLGGQEICRLLVRAGGRNIVRKLLADSEVYSTLIDLPVNQAFARINKMLNTAAIPYTSDSFPKKGRTPIESVDEDVVTITNSYMCPDRDAGIVVVINGIGDELSVVTIISQAY